MIKSAVVVAVALMMSAQSVAAQDTRPMMDMEAVIKAAEDLYNPAAFALKHRKDLSLTDAQVKTLESLSSGSNRIDLMNMPRPSTDENEMNQMLMDPSMSLDEEVIKKGTQARVERETRLALNRARADREVVAALTGLQRAAYANLRMMMFTDMMSATMGGRH